jgi:hypothetical protein
MAVGNDLSFELPRGWTERLGSNGTKECLAGSDGSSGILQISELDSGDHRFLSAQAELGAVAQAMALGLSARGQNWGEPGLAQQGPCALGRFGVSMSTTGQFPVMILWITISERSAFMWTWLGPDPTAAEVRQAFDVVLAVRHAGSN